MNFIREEVLEILDSKIGFTEDSIALMKSKEGMSRDVLRKSGELAALRQLCGQIRAVPGKNKEGDILSFLSGYAEMSQMVCQTYQSVVDQKQRSIRSRNLFG